MPTPPSRLSRRAALLLPLAATGCKTLDDWFGDKKVPLAGTRIAIGGPQRGLKVDNAAGHAVALPPQTADSSWPQSGGTPAHAPGNPAFGPGLRTAWSTKIGTPGGYRRRITASPVVGGGRVYAMDADATVSACDQRSGARLWQTKTALKTDRSTNLGGGLALDGATLYASTGLGALLALDAGTGKITWRKRLDSPARAAPTVVDDRLYVPTLLEQVVAFAKGDGTRQWGYQGTNTPTSVLGLPSPAYADGLVVAGFGTGDLVCLRGATGSVSWSDGLASGINRDPLLDFSTITGLPVIADGQVYAVGMGGLFVALDLRTGRRLWERDVTSNQTPWLAGDWLFVLTTEQLLGAVNRADGSVPWVTQLPLYRNQKAKQGPIDWIGPVLAGDRLILAGSHREALTVNPLTGAIMSSTRIPGVAAVPPVVADRTLFVVNEDATLVALT